MAAKDSPLKQFEIIPFSKTEVGSYDISFTNSSLRLLALHKDGIIFTGRIFAKRSREDLSFSKPDSGLFSLGN